MAAKKRDKGNPRPRPARPLHEWLKDAWFEASHHDDQQSVQMSNILQFLYLVEHARAVGRAPAQVEMLALAKASERLLLQRGARFVGSAGPVRAAKVRKLIAKAKEAHQFLQRAQIPRTSKRPTVFTIVAATLLELARNLGLAKASRLLSSPKAEFEAVQEVLEAKLVRQFERGKPTDHLIAQWTLEALGVPAKTADGWVTSALKDLSNKT